MVLDTTTAAAALKTYYSRQRMINLTYKDAPLYAMLNKVKDFYGANYPLPMRITNPQGRSGTFSNAQAQKKESKYKTFTLTRTHDYSLASIATEAMLASENDAGAFLRLATAEIDGAIESLKRSIAWSLYGDGSGSLGTIGAVDAASDKITLANVEDISKIEVGQTLVVWSAASGGTQRTYDGTNTSVVVATVDRDAGSFTVEEDIDGSSTIAAGDHLFVSGDRGVKLKGLAAWVPSVAPTAGESFFGVDRSLDASRMAGIRNDASGKPLDEAIVDAARQAGRHGADPDTLFLGFGKYAALEKTLGARVRYIDREVAGIGFRGIEVAGPKRSIHVFADRDCPEANGYMLSMDTLALYSLKEPIMLLDQDGNKLLRESTADAMEVRVGGYFQMGCDNPRENLVMSFS